MSFIKTFEKKIKGNFYLDKLNDGIYEAISIENIGFKDINRASPLDLLIHLENVDFRERRLIIQVSDFLKEFKQIKK